MNLTFQLSTLYGYILCNILIYFSWLIWTHNAATNYFYMFQDLIGLTGDELAQFMPKVGEK